MVGLPEIIQSAFIATASSIVFLNLVPGLRSRFLAYGLRSTPAGNEKNDGKRDPRARSSSEGLVPWVLDGISAVRAPHGYFRHFYMLSVLSSIFWGIQILNQGFGLKIIASMAGSGNSTTSMSMDRIILLWSFLLVQGVRRWIESVFVAKTSASEMWFVHYFLGMGFYLIMGIAIWIEGAGEPVIAVSASETVEASNSLRGNHWLTRSYQGTILSSESPRKDISFSAPSKRAMLCVPMFVLASGIQHHCHAYLASLRKYTLPIHSMFQLIVCPHYFAECLIYTSMAVLGAPKGAWVNKTMASALLFVLANLGVTASISKEWYAQKFGKDQVAGRWKMIPLLY